MKSKCIYLLVILIIFLVISSSGCFESNDNKDKKPREKMVGDTWTYKVTHKGIEPMTMKYTITSTSYLYNGRETLARSVSISVKGYIDEEYGFIYDDGIGTGFAYYDKVTNEPIHIELSITVKYKENSNDVWHNMRTDTVKDYQHTGNYPGDYEIGDTWTITTTETSISKIWIDDEKISDNTTSDTITENYEVLGKIRVTVEAGIFDCLEIRGDDMDETTYELNYYSDEVQNFAKTVEYNGMNIISITELISYELK